jgi:peptidyl-dipeptidase A
MTHDTLARIAASLLALPLATPAFSQARSPAAPPAAGASPAGGPSAPSAADVKKFLAAVNDDLQRLAIRQQTAEWIKSTYITDDTERNAAAMNEDLMAYLSKAIPEGVRLAPAAGDADAKRMLHLLEIATSLPAPKDPAKRRELADIAARLEGIYGKGKWCGTPAPGKKAPRCRDLLDLEETLAKSRDHSTLLDAWAGWHTISREMRPLYGRLVELGNEGAKEIGFEDVGALWRSGYDMSPADVEADVDRLWNEVRPLYEQLHCYVRARLQKAYGKERVPDGKPIPAHLLGNMWAQEWNNVYDLVEPYPGVASLDVDAALRRQKWDPARMVKAGEAFFSSLGFAPLPKSFWERSMFTKPRDREVVCHASAWDVTMSGDLRIKMCIRQREEDLVTIHHELGHNYYQRAYLVLPALYQNSANDGFHEALGDTIALSVTPGYLKTIGLVGAAPKDERAAINFQMKRALDGIAFLPFGLLVDKWRWDVFGGETPPSGYDAHWWELRRKYQGVDAPVLRSEQDFDPGAKYHIPANVPYLRYFLARIYQYQFHRSLCEAAGWKGPLHECSIHGSKEAGKRLGEMMAMGSSRPWQDAMQALTGERKADATALLSYYAPLRAWLEKQNAGRVCGW